MEDKITRTYRPKIDERLAQPINILAAVSDETAPEWIERVLWLAIAGESELFTDALAEMAEGEPT